MAQQIPMPLPIAESHAEDDFMPAASNAAAAKAIYETMPRTVLLLGPTGSGKTHLAQIWQRRFGAAAVDFTPEQIQQGPALLWEDADRSSWNAALQQRAFHLLNLVRESQKPLLITASEPPINWPLHLADLRSRLLALPVARLEQPDDALVAALLLKHLKDRQLKPGEDVLNYLIPRLPRDGRLIADIVRELDEASLAGRRALTIPFVKTVLEKFG